MAYPFERWQTLKTIGRRHIKFLPPAIQTEIKAADAYQKGNQRKALRYAKHALKEYMNYHLSSHGQDFSTDPMDPGVARPKDTASLARVRILAAYKHLDSSLSLQNFENETLNKFFDAIVDQQAKIPMKKEERMAAMRPINASRLSRKFRFDEYRRTLKQNKRPTAEQRRIAARNAGLTQEEAIQETGNLYRKILLKIAASPTEMTRRMKKT